MLLDSNIIIYSFLPEFQELRDFLSHCDVSCSVISSVETLGYHKLSDDEKYYLKQFFTMVPVLPVTQHIVNTAITLRQQKKMSLGDVLIAATALENRQTLVTRNTKDFDWIEGLKVVNPLA
ncbi:MAG: type II toxin-antitoxin system VapC family toxin [Candidatus Electrothrix sp. AR1]|nr:type II toxin-antitoxin system VapC family toxin [Candidatus Electrothrix sp. AR1]